MSTPPEFLCLRIKDRGTWQARAQICKSQTHKLATNYYHHQFMTTTIWKKKRRKENWHLLTIKNKIFILSASNILDNSFKFAGELMKKLKVMGWFYWQLQRMIKRTISKRSPIASTMQEQCFKCLINSYSDWQEIPSVSGNISMIINVESDKKYLGWLIRGVHLK